MRNRFLVTIIVLALFILSLPFAIIYLSNDYIVLYGVVTAILLTYSFIYFFAGFSKFVIYAIYSTAIILLLFFLPEFNLVISIVGAIVVIINPLAAFEFNISKELNDDEVLPIKLFVRRAYWPFYLYRREMTNYYYLPQAKKLFTKKWYSYLRKLTTFLLLGLGLFLLYYEVGILLATLSAYRVRDILIFFVIISCFILAVTLYRKGFQSTLRLAISLLFVPLVYVIAISTFSLTFRIIAGVIIGILGIAYTLYERTITLKKVVYSSYQYYDHDLRRETYANALYEPLVYNESFTLVGIYKLRVPITKFDKLFSDLLYYANRKLFIITAYTHDDEYATIYTEFQEKDAKRAVAFLNYLRKLFSVPVLYDITIDKDKNIYEQKFFKKSEYIVARTIALAELLLELSVDTKIIISMVCAFDSLDDVQAISNLKKYSVVRLPELDTGQSYCVRISTKSQNSKFIIEQTVHDMLLSLMLYNGVYVRVMVYY